MATLNDKFNEVKTLITLITQHLPHQAKDECDNGVNICIEAKNSFETIKAKCIDKFGEDELWNDFENVINTYL